MPITKLTTIRLISKRLNFFTAAIGSSITEQDTALVFNNECITQHKTEGPPHYLRLDTVFRIRKLKGKSGVTLYGESGAIPVAVNPAPRTF
jgi:hypothetical protein